MRPVHLDCYTADQMQAAYQAGEATAREDLTIAYMSGYHKGRDAAKAECQQECSAEATDNGTAQRIAKAIEELK